MKTTAWFGSYELLINKADSAFEKIRGEYKPHVTCHLHCSDCCHAVFGLFLIEVAYLKHHFDQLDKALIKETFTRCNDAERAMKRLEVKMRNYQDDPAMQALVMAQERIRCPLLSDDEECILYPHRPVTCRVYGIPTMVQRKARVCGKTGFKKGESYPIFNLDELYRELFLLSQQFLTEAERGDPAKADLLISVSKAVHTPLEDLIFESFE